MYFPLVPFNPFQFLIEDFLPDLVSFEVLVNCCFGVLWVIWGIWCIPYKIKNQSNDKTTSESLLFYFILFFKAYIGYIIIVYYVHCLSCQPKYYIVLNIYFFTIIHFECKLYFYKTRQIYQMFEGLQARLVQTEIVLE